MRGSYEALSTVEFSQYSLKRETVWSFFLRLQCLVFACVVFASPLESQEVDRTLLPPKQPAFDGKIGRTYKDSTPDWRPALPLQAP